MVHNKLLQIFSNECHWSRDGKIDFDVFDFIRIICRLSINIRIKFHFFVCSGKRKDTRRV